MISYYKPPRDHCEVCGKLLYDRKRYRVRLYLRDSGVLFKDMVVCQECLLKVKRDKGIRKRFKVRYRRMRDLNQWAVW